MPWGLRFDRPAGEEQIMDMAISGARVDVLGVGISALNLDSAKRTILERLAKKEKGYICVTGVHGVIEAQDDSKFRGIQIGRAHV